VSHSKPIVKAKPASINDTRYRVHDVSFDMGDPSQAFCGRCKTPLVRDTAEYCFFCLGWLCGKCWEEFGECGHLELKSKTKFQETEHTHALNQVGQSNEHLGT